MKTLPTVIRASDLAAYAPVNHTGTSNVRVIGPETVGATALEVLVGTIVKSHGAKPHAHPHLEQCAYMIEGTGESEAQGRVEAMGPGTWTYVPAGAFEMGDRSGDGLARERPVHSVTLDAFYIGKFEITNREWKKFRDDEYLWVRVAEKSFDDFVYSQPTRR